MPIITKQVKETERFLHKILPIRIQHEIYNNCRILTDRGDKELRLDYLDYTDKAFEELIYIKNK